jgi:hypothetical protein
MTYSVVWDFDAISTLAEIWIQAADRARVTAAQARIDSLLGVNPLAAGTPVSEGLYAIQVYSLRALFEVDESDRLVRVVSVGELAS